MKYLVILALLLVPAVACADSLDTLVDTLTGKNDSAPLLITGEVLKQFDDVKGIADIQVGIGYTGSARRLTHDNQVNLISRVIF